MARIVCVVGSVQLSVLCALAGPAAAQASHYQPAGELEGVTAKGVTAQRVYYPDLRFPLAHGPAYLNSQVYRPGGGKASVAGDQCAKINYSYPWHDNFCEPRGYVTPMCPSGNGHQGQDIRAASCVPNLHWAVAVADGVIAQIGQYSVTLQAPSGTIFRYLHLNMKQLAVTRLAHVKQGDNIGKVSNDFNGVPTTRHLHFEIKDTIDIKGVRQATFLPPYASLIHAYEKLPATETAP